MLRVKILVPVKRVVDYNVKIRVKRDGSGVDLANVKMSMNPFDEIALEEAVKMKEASIADEVIAVSVGDAGSQESLRAALAVGADRAILIEVENGLQPINIAKLLKAITLRESADLVFLGKQAIDDDAAQTGQMLAGLLDWPQGTFASKVSISNGNVEVTREVDGGLEVLSFQLPAIITADLRLNTPRFATLPNIMKAKKKPLEIVKAFDLCTTLNQRIKVLKVQEPPPRKGGILVPDVATLVEKLRTVAKVI